MWSCGDSQAYSEGRLSVPSQSASASELPLSTPFVIVDVEAVVGGSVSQQIDRAQYWTDSRGDLFRGPPRPHFMNAVRRRQIAASNGLPLRPFQIKPAYCSFEGPCHFVPATRSVLSKRSTMFIAERRYAAHILVAPTLQASGTMVSSMQGSLA